ncbi:MAG: ABC transporter ATP-binding protein [Chloroflexi bacterium]|nr:ABC transporter ATP-binding protein [Chloroflexota bacterium]
MSTELITAKTLSKEYKRGSEQVHALKKVDLSIKDGEFISIVGPSGSGKSTLLYLLGLLDSPSKGSITIRGKETSGLEERELVKLRRENIGFVFQQFLLLPTLNVRENMELPLLFSKKNGKPEKITEIIDMLGLSHREKHLPHQLSGGEMQRVSIARALINQPKILMADEPTGNLDSATAEKIYEIFKKLNQAGLTLIVVTHNMELATMAHRVIKLKDGEISSS